MIEMREKRWLVDKKFGYASFFDTFSYIKNYKFKLKSL